MKWVVVVVGGLQHFSVSPRPLSFGFWGFGAKGLGPGLDNRHCFMSEVIKKLNSLLRISLLVFLVVMNVCLCVFSRIPCLVNIRNIDFSKRSCRLMFSLAVHR